MGAVGWMARASDLVVVLPAVRLRGLATLTTVRGLVAATHGATTAIVAANAHVAELIRADLR
jgi:hypothetical protein